MIRGAEDRRHLGLPENVVYLVLAHCIVEANRGHVVIHAGQESLWPLGPIRAVNTDEAPHFSLAGDLWCEIESDHAAGQILDILRNLTVTLPHIISVDRLALVISAHPLARAQEWVFSSPSHMVFEERHVSLKSVLNAWLRI